MSNHPWVFAVEDTTVQLAWGRLARGTHRLAVGLSEVEVDVTGPGTLVFDGLAPDTEHDVRLDGRTVARARTLVPPAGELLCRVATISDVHIGERSFGFRNTMEDTAPPYAPAYPERCLRAALHGAQEWGAEHLVVKGDLTQSGRAHQLHTAARELVAAGIPATVTVGNHDVERGSIDPDDVLAQADYGLRALRAPEAMDLPGLRVVVADSTIPGKHHGRVQGERSDAIVDLVAETPRGSGCLVALHHQPYHRAVPTFWPPGIWSWEAAPFLDRIATAFPNTLVTSGHTHRNRARHRGPLLLTEVGSTKDWPGTWAGYAVHEGGIRQVVRKVTGNDTDRWLWYTRRAVYGLWGHWSPGSLDDRCISHPWPT